MRSYPALLVYARCWYVFKTTMMVFYQNMGSQAKMDVKAVVRHRNTLLSLRIRFVKSSLQFAHLHEDSTFL